MKVKDYTLSEYLNDDHMDILYVTKEPEEKYHYVLIQNFNRVMFIFSNHKGTKHFLRRCLHCFSTKSLLEKHKEDCFALNGTQAIDMPPSGSKIYFKNNHTILPVPFVIYADFEAITDKIPTFQPPNKKSFTTTYQKHHACGYG